MKPGDLCRLIDGAFGSTTWMYGGDEVPWDGGKRLLRSGIPFGFNDVGLVLARVEDSAANRSDGFYIKVHTHRGTGWVIEDFVEKIS
jgi:hypothetical protein